MSSSYKNLIELIWYNPKSGRYQCGNWVQYNTLIHENGEDGFGILYQTNELSSRIANKIVKELNVARKTNPTSSPIYAF